LKENRRRGIGTPGIYCILVAWVAANVGKTERKKRICIFIEGKPKEGDRHPRYLLHPGGMGGSECWEN